MNFTRPQICISKKEDVEKLKRDIEEGGIREPIGLLQRLIAWKFDRERPISPSGSDFYCIHIAYRIHGKDISTSSFSNEVVTFYCCTVSHTCLQKMSIS